jgi:hypothetical protein
VHLWIRNLLWVIDPRPSDKRWGWKGAGVVGKRKGRVRRRVWGMKEGKGRKRVRRMLPQLQGTSWASGQAPIRCPSSVLCLALDQWALRALSIQACAAPQAWTVGHGAALCALGPEYQTICWLILTDSYTHPRSCFRTGGCRSRSNFNHCAAGRQASVMCRRGVRKVRQFREAESEHLRAHEFPPCDLTSHHVCDGVDELFLI